MNTHRRHPRPGRLIACASAIASVASLAVVLAIERWPSLQMTMLLLWSLCV